MCCNKYSITSLARANNVGRIFILNYSSPQAPTGSNLPTRPNTKPQHRLLQSIPTRLQFSPTLAHLGKAYVPFFFPSRDDHHPWLSPIERVPSNTSSDSAGGHRAPRRPISSLPFPNPAFRFAFLPISAIEPAFWCWLEGLRISVPGCREYASSNAFSRR
jgi:hypothetical protein